MLGTAVNHDPALVASWALRRAFNLSWTEESNVIAARSWISSIQAPWSLQRESNEWFLRFDRLPDCKVAAKGGPNTGAVTHSRRTIFHHPSGALDGAASGGPIAAVIQLATAAASQHVVGLEMPAPPNRIGRHESDHCASPGSAPRMVAHAARNMGSTSDAAQHATKGQAVRKIQFTLQAEKHCRRIREAA